MLLVGAPLWITKRGRPVYKEMLACGHEAYHRILGATSSSFRAKSRRCPTCHTVQAIVKLLGNVQGAEVVSEYLERLKVNVAAKAADELRDTLLAAISDLDLASTARDAGDAHG